MLWLRVALPVAWNRTSLALSNTEGATPGSARHLFSFIFNNNPRYF